MRSRFVVCLIALFSVALSAQAQENLLPPCGNSALAMLAEIQPEFETLIADEPTAFDEGSFAPYIDAYFSWRERLWSQLPLCAEMFDIAVLMDRIAGNLVANAAMDAALLENDRLLQLNPYDAEDFGPDSLPIQLERQIATVAARLNDDTRVTEEASALPACSDDDYDYFYSDVFDPYLGLGEMLARGRGIRTLLLVVESLLEWRGQVWRGLPACAGMHEITWPMTQAASAFIVFGAFDLADMKAEADLFNAELARKSATIAEMTPAFLGQAAPDAQPPESSLPGCARSQLTIFNTIIVEYAELVNATGEIAAVDDVFDFGKRQYAWREIRLANLPRCAEAFELGLLIDQSTGDIVLAMALLLSGVDAGDIPHVEAIQAGTAKMSALVTPVLQGERAATDSPLPAPLPQCSDAQLGVITSEIEPDFRELMAADSAAESVEDLLSLGAMQIEFRDSVWRRLPACAEAYDIAWLMYRISGDSLLTWALMVAGAAEADIPYSATALEGRRLNDMLAAIDDAADSEG